jgi:hypothetical protein
MNLINLIREAFTHLRMRLSTSPMYQVALRRVVLVPL